MQPRVSDPFAALAVAAGDLPERVAAGSPAATLIRVGCAPKVTLVRRSPPLDDLDGVAGLGRSVDAGYPAQPAQLRQAG
jgi:hypothetical protein